MPTLLFGSISTLVDTSELQRAAFNVAFDRHGLPWTWGRDEYRELLTGNGGRQRIADYAEEQGTQVDATAVHETKSELFRESLRSSPLGLRPGVADTLQAAREQGWRVALVTTTSRENLDALFDGVDGLSAADFEVVTDTSSVEQGKPDPAVYTFALGELGEPAGAAVAVEDNVGGVRSAQAAGVACVAFANENTVMHDFGDTPRVTRLALDDLAGLVAERA
ncbi:haloacid dehalogenase superfamily, subfamily IA, variant 3 with third motif having DD or ED [Jatrophihabitans endophyticus]|uniref:Haloacid dehalogenase superfamily, subfamily IA, variant 3 with third motif having DD or ED n=1 Tax=Jatrophihabitans endophyticus TaxID=1206085 RepID=A0A1M5U3X3_9ACTN|nr:HAD-IA family hydrolase [Jatrophihabitans endophyticus]SHH57556.1 haloacid dehalogenase superfamily, subfamily IA, variant 3 with third motif having DD or ED [Jatrophihabitans endophyticus]